MGFPPGWKLPLGSRNGLRAVGNAVPVPLSAAIMRAALGETPVADGLAEADALAPSPERRRKRARRALRTGARWPSSPRTQMSSGHAKDPRQLTKLKRSVDKFGGLRRYPVTGLIM